MDDERRRGAQPAANATVVPVAEPTLAPKIRLPLKNVDTVACAGGCGIFDVGASGGMDFISSAGRPRAVQAPDAYDF